MIINKSFYSLRTLLSWASQCWRSCKPRGRFLPHENKKNKVEIEICRGARNPRTHQTLVLGKRKRHLCLLPANLTDSERKEEGVHLEVQQRLAFNPNHVLLVHSLVDRIGFLEKRARGRASRRRPRPRRRASSIHLSPPPVSAAAAMPMRRN